MSIDKDTVKYTAHLARIELGDKELAKLSTQLHDILGFIDKLSKLNVENVQPTSHILPINTVLREDKPGESLPIEKTLANAPERKDNFFTVPKVIE
jgi:aspartyl-tRNA(Asn)/glutamyl-tRNA(Gln) amidotransferase subunit C